jgi:hypothetical protein
VHYCIWVLRWIVVRDWVRFLLLSFLRWPFHRGAIPSISCPRGTFFEITFSRKHVYPSYVLWIPFPRVTFLRTSFPRVTFPRISFPRISFPRVTIPRISWIFSTILLRVRFRAEQLWATVNFKQLWATGFFKQLWATAFFQQLRFLSDFYQLRFLGYFEQLRFLSNCGF